MAEQREYLRAIPLGGARWVVQNLTKATEYDVDLEQMICTCPRSEIKHEQCKHLDYALKKAPVPSPPGKRVLFITKLRERCRKIHGALSAAQEFDEVLALAWAALAERKRKKAA